LPQKLILATRNPDKIQEIRRLLDELDIEVMTLDSFPEAPAVIEDGDTLAANALKKARVIHEFTGLTAVSDDTGLEVEYLEGAPGVYSSRYAGESATYANNVDKLLADLNGVPFEQRRARFRTVVAIVGRHTEQILTGRIDGYIVDTPTGSGGFGYDPIFYIPEYQQTFAEMDSATKNKISHRAKAFATLLTWLKAGPV